MYNVGRYGFNWLSTIPAGSTNAHNLGFYSGGVGPNNGGYRAYGFSLRCLQE
ncbi:MAG: hypothetical protein K2K83_05280 [Rikenella sp.]|nr:hypothetical protein [Rikenella sp.]